MEGLAEPLADTAAAGRAQRGCSFLTCSFCGNVRDGHKELAIQVLNRGEHLGNSGKSMKV